MTELDWTPWAEFREIELAVCPPVQREIDRQKNRGNGRVGRRARKAASMLRAILLSGEDFRTIRESAPMVRLVIDAHEPAGADIDDRLDPSVVDDRLVACAVDAAARVAGAEVRLLTDDMGPMAKAKMMGLPFTATPEEWRRPPEASEEERIIEKLSLIHI